MYDMSEHMVMAKGLVERIGLSSPNFIFENYQGMKVEAVAKISNHSEALELICDKLIDSKYGVLARLNEVEAIGHRVVHGAEKFTQPVVITQQVKETVQECSSLAPLHNPPNLGGIEACEKVFPGVPNVGVFDTAFHQSMPAASYLYAIPFEQYEKNGIRKYGFHGTSHKFVYQATAKFLGKSENDIKLITCHLGNGCSIAAIDGGKVLDTSMGMTPLMGLMMGTRCGDIDPGVVLHLIKGGMSVEQVDKLLNKESGLLGVADIGSSDMRDVLAACAEGNEKATMAVDMFIHRLVLYIGSYYTILGGADAVVFTGGLGENSVEIRSKVIKRLNVLGCFIDEDKAGVRREAAVISSDESSMKAVVMPTDEELMIAQETVNVLSN